MKRLGLVLLCLCLASCGVLAESTAYLPSEALQSLQPSFEAFLEALADTLVEKGLLQTEEREAWIYYQLGDYMQNGGFGTISITYAPGLLGYSEETVSMRRFSLETDAGTLILQTLRRYAENYSPLPGLPLDVELIDENNRPVPCRFRWVASDGSFLIWDSTKEEVVNVGSMYIGDGQPLYWYAEPVEGIDETLTLEVLYAMDDETMATASLTLISGADYWAPEGLK